MARLRAEAAERMGLIDVERRTGESSDETLARMSTPKVVLLAPPAAGGVVCTRSFIPTRVHQAIGVLGADSVAAAVVLPGTIAEEVAQPSADGATLRIEHPTGHLDVRVEMTADPDRPLGTTSFVRTARLLLDGIAYPGPRSGRLRGAPSTTPRATPGHPAGAGA